MAHQSIPSVPIPPPSPWEFVGPFSFCFFSFCPTVELGVHTKTPRRGLKIRSKCPTQVQHQNCIFEQDKLQIPYIWEICNNLIKLAQEALYTNHSQLLVEITAKKIIDLINLNDRRINQNFNNSCPFLNLEDG